MSQHINCLSCGAANQLTDGKDSMFCEFCGNSIIKIKQANDHADPAEDPKIKNYLELAQNAMDSSDFDEAISYFNKVLENNPKIAEAWFGKGYCSGWNGNLSSIKVDQMVINYKKAIEYSTEENLQELKIKIAEAINGCAFAIYNLSYSHTVEFAQVDGTYGEHLIRSTDVLFALEYAYTINPQSKSIVESILSISKNLLKPIKYKNYDDKWESLSLNSSSNKKIKDIYDKYFQIMEGIDPEFVNRIKKQEDQVKKIKLTGLVIAIVFVLFLYFKTCNGSNSQSNNDNFQSTSTSYSEPNQTNTNEEEINRQEQSNSSINDEPLLLQSVDNANSQLTKEIAKQLYLTFSEAVINENEQQLVECFSPNLKIWHNESDVSRIYVIDKWRNDYKPKWSVQKDELISFVETTMPNQFQYKKLFIIKSKLKENEFKSFIITGIVEFDENRDIVIMKDNKSIRQEMSFKGRYPEASIRLLRPVDLSSLSGYELKIMRNEIFARKGYIFKTEDMRQYFNSQSWYRALYNDVNHLLSDTELSNIELIKAYE